MTIHETIEQLKSIRENSESYAQEEDGDSIWHKDIEAIDNAIYIIKDWKSIRDKEKI